MKLSIFRCHYFLDRHFFYYFFAWDLIYSKLTTCLRIKAFSQTYNHHLTFLLDKLCRWEFHNPRNIFRSFICCNMCYNLKICLICILFQGHLLIEYKFSTLILTNLCCKNFRCILKFHFAWKLNLHFNWLDIEGERVNLYLFFSHVLCFN